MHSSGVWTTEAKPIFARKNLKLKGVVHLHPVLNPNNLWACPFFQKPRHCSYMLKMGIFHCTRSLVSSVWQSLAWQLLNASGVPGWKTSAGLQLTRAHPSFPLSPWSADAGRAGMGHGAADQHLLPPVRTNTGSSFHPPVTFLSPAGLSKQGGQHRLQRSVSPGAEGPSFPLPYPARKAMRMGDATQTGTRRKGHGLLCSWQSREQAVTQSSLIG